jgi:hypothetical protein
MPIPSQPDSPLHGERWRRRDFLAAGCLFAATAAVILWQNAHLVILWDLSYVLDTSVRFADGQMPYRDFPLVHTPLTFLVQAAILRLFPGSYYPHIVYPAVIGGLGTVVSWRIVLHTLRCRVRAAWFAALVLAAPLTVLGIYCILPHPSYDCDCAFSMLVAVYLLQRLPATFTSRPGLGRAFITGAALCVPAFFKQNMGLPFLLAAVTVILLLFVAGILSRADQPADLPGPRALLAVLAGAATTFLAAMLLIELTAGIGDFLHWTVQFAGERRLPGFAAMLGIYADPTLFWMALCVVAALIALRSRFAATRWVRLLAVLLLAAPFLFTLSSVFIFYDDPDSRGDSLVVLWPLLLVFSATLAAFNLLRCRINLQTLLPLILLVAIHGTFLSQQLWGSTYAIWPLLIFLVADLVAELPSLQPPAVQLERPALAIAAVIALTLAVCGGFYTASEERLSYAQLPDGPAVRSSFPQLAGMATPGPYLPEFDELLRYAQANIPFSDGIILIPGEDPFYFATGRVPQFPVLLFDRSTDPYTPADVVREARVHRIQWLILKRDLQIKEDPTPQREATLALLMKDFAPAAHLKGYDVYRRVAPAPPAPTSAP